MLKTMTGFYDQMHIESPDAQARTIFVDTGTVLNGTLVVWCYWNSSVRTGKPSRR